MNDAILMQLKILVERVVRPVRASISRKRKMREELLGHVTAVFAEESAKLGDEIAALGRTKERFGNTAELTGQLEKSLPERERRVWSWETWAFPSRKSSIYLAVRNVLFMVPILLFMWVVFIPTLIGANLKGLSNKPLADDLISFMLGMGTVHGILLAFLFCSTLLVCGMRQAIFGSNGRSWPKVFLLVVLSILLVPSGFFLCFLAGSGDVWSSLWQTSLLYPFYVAVPFLVAILTFIDARWRRFDQDWASLKVD